MPDLKDYYAYKSTQDPSGGNGGPQGSGSGIVVIIIVAIMLIYFIFSNASWDAIDCLLGWGFLAYLLARWLFS